MNFTDLSTESPYEWFWELGDGATSDEQNPTHIYADNGIYSVCLTATNVGGINTYCEDITIISAIAPPVAAYSYLIIDLQVAFVDESTASPTTWFWEFGDGTTSTEQNPVYVFDGDGAYFVCLTVTNEGGNDTACKELLFETGIINENISELNIYPNPANEILFFKLNETISKGDLAVYYSAGKIILIENIEGKILLK